MIYFRTDASFEIGYGHFFRCINLAKYLIAKNINCKFLISLENEIVKKQLSENDIGFNLVKPYDKFENKNFQNSILILDIKNNFFFKDEELFFEYIKNIANNFSRTISFEDYSLNISSSEIVIIPYYGLKTTFYKLNPKQNLILGSDFFIYDEKILKQKTVKVNKVVKNIFLCMGGSDPHLATESLLEFFAETKYTFNINIVLMTVSKAREKKIHNILKKYRGQYKVHENPINFYDIISDSDIGIISSGLLKYETSKLGLPCISVCVEESHFELMEFFNNDKILINLGYFRNISKINFLNTLDNLIDDISLRKKINQICLEKFDGLGKERLYKLLTN